MAVSSQTPSGNINAVPEIIKLIRPVAISINAPSGNSNIVLAMYTYTPSGYLNTAEIEKHIHAPSGHINTPNKFNLNAPRQSQYMCNQ